MSTQFLNQKQLAKRWAMSHRTLERWRCRGTGPGYLKLGGKIAYRLVDIEAYEARHTRQSTASLASADDQFALLVARSSGRSAQNPEKTTPIVEKRSLA